MTAARPLITCDDLHRLMADQAASLSVIDASWHLPGSARDGRKDYQLAHIPGALYFDIDAVSDATSSLPHMLPSADSFAESMQMLGIKANSLIVVYDTHGLYSAARVWWMFKVFGHQNVQVLDGGLPAWRAQGGALEGGETRAMPSEEALGYTLNRAAVASFSDVAQVITDRSATLLDARPKARFDGLAAEPRKGLRSGHMPGAISTPITDLLEADENQVMRLKSPHALHDYFVALNLTPNDALITTCGSGVTAAVITLALEVAGFTPGRLYDGSWSEWGAAADSSVVTC